MSQQILSLDYGRFNCIVKQIVRIEASSNYSKIYIAGSPQPYLACKVLNWLEQTLPSADFIRVHRSHLVNKKFICTPLTANFDCIALTNGDTVEVSRRRKSGLKFSAS